MNSSRHFALSFALALGALSWCPVADCLGQDEPTQALLDEQRMQGAWQISHCEFGGAAAGTKGATHSVRGNELHRPGLRTGVYELALNPGTSPKQVDLGAQRLGDEKLPGIYDISGDVLKVCYSYDPSLPRPEHFTTQEGAPYYLYVYQRADANAETSTSAIDALMRQRMREIRSTRLSPFTDLESLRGDTIRVEFEGQFFELVSIAGLTAQELVDAAKGRFALQWEKRLAEDLMDVLATVGKKPTGTVSVELMDPNSGEIVEISDAPLTNENRDQIRENRNRRLYPAGSSGYQRAMLDAFANELRLRWSYVQAGGFDLDAITSDIDRKITAGLSADDFLFELEQVIGHGIDGHARLRTSSRTVGYLPCQLDTVGDQVVAFQPDRSAFVDTDHPLVVTIDGRAIEQWCSTVSCVVPNGSRQYVRHHCLRELQYLQFWRKRAGLPTLNSVTLELSSVDQSSTKKIRLPIGTQFSRYDIWPASESQVLEGGVGYLRIESMDEQAVSDIRRWMSEFRDTRGLIVDVRDNGGGSRDALRWMFSYFCSASDPPRVVNAAAYRLHPDHSTAHLQPRFLAPYESRDWTAAEQEAIAEFRKAFEPEWKFNQDNFSPWHYMVLSRLDDPDIYHYTRPVVILMNSKCFSATDIFLSGLKGLPGVTLVGTPSGGGSARKQGFELGRLEVHIASMASFQANGKLYDGHGVQPDVLVEPAADYYVGGEDNMLGAALRIITDEGASQ